MSSETCWPFSCCDCDSVSYHFNAFH